MIYIGDSFRVYYKANNFKKNLHDILMYVYKPNGLQQGPYILQELANQGIYYIDYLDSDIEGTYLFIIDSLSNPAKDAKQQYFIKKLALESTAEAAQIAAADAVILASAIANKTEDLVAVVNDAIGEPHSTVFSELNDIKALITGEAVEEQDSAIRVTIKGPYANGQVRISETRWVAFSNYLAKNIPLNVAIKVIQNPIYIILW